MSYSLAAFNPSGVAKEFSVNNYTYQIVLTITHQLCPEAFVAVTVHPPDGTSPNYRAGWGGNDGQYVAGADAAALGHALAAAIAAGQATEPLRAYFAETGWDGRHYTADTIVVAFLRRLCEFARFLTECNGFDIR